MFKIVALIYLLVGGVPGANPDDTFTLNKTFENAEACTAFLASDEMKNATVGLTDALKSQIDVPFNVVTKCESFTAGE